MLSGMILRRGGDQRITGIRVDTSEGTPFVSCVVDESDMYGPLSEPGEFAFLRDKQIVLVEFPCGAVERFEAVIFDEGEDVVFSIEPITPTQEAPAPECPFIGGWCFD